MNRNKLNSSVALLTYRREVAAGNSDEQLADLAQIVRSREIDRNLAGKPGKGLGGSKARLDSAVSEFARYAERKGIPLYEFPPVE